MFFISYVCLLLVYLISFARVDSDHLLIDHDSTILSSVEGSPFEKVYKDLYFIICNKSGKMIQKQVWIRWLSVYIL